MHNLLSKYFEKKNLDVETLSSEEKETFDRWNSTLENKPLTVEKIAEFCGKQKKLIGEQFRNLDNSPTKTERLALLLGVWTLLEEMITAPDNERIALERHIQELLDAK